MEVKIAESWKSRLRDEFEKEYFQKLVEFVKSEYKSKKVFPPGNLIFNAFDKCSFEQTKVVILGQDPYHGAGQAHGLSFSVNEGIAKPPSLQNIFKEIENDLGIKSPVSGNLERWANQGVLLLNATLTVRANEAGSHQNQGWEQFTDTVIQTLSNEKQNVVFMLWGAYAQKKGAIIDSNKHFILKSKHPSPMAANQGGWFGMHHFSQCNNYLSAKGLGGIEW
ncbi:MAG: uracil-DNA glycosylase [Bacteroidota bacterium]